MELNIDLIELLDRKCEHNETEFAWTNKLKLSEWEKLRNEMITYYYENISDIFNQYNTFFLTPQKFILHICEHYEGEYVKAHKSRRDFNLVRNLNKKI